MLSGSAGAELQADALARFLPLVREPQFLDSPALTTADPLAPCALVAAVTASAILNRFFYGLSSSGAVDLRPPPGTNMVGMYDADFARGKGAIPREDPAKSADMLARTVVWRSWGISTQLNTLISTLTQRKCLDMLVQPNLLVQVLNEQKPKSLVMTHGAPVSSFIFSVDGVQGRQWLEALLKPEALEQRAAATDHPLTPCSLLRTFRLAARLNNVWGNLLPAGKLDVTGRLELAPYAEALSKPLGVDSVDAKTAEVLAAAMAAEIARSNWLSRQLVDQATQGECLNELFEPGGLRQKLLRAGKTLPQH